MESKADSTSRIIPELSLNRPKNRPSEAWYYVMSGHVSADGEDIVPGGLTQL